jgi:hypothetical protein
MTGKMPSSHTVASANNEGTLTYLFKELVSMDSREMTKISVDFSMIQFANTRIGVMRDINVDGHLIDSFILLYFERLLSGFISLEVGSFIHIEPQS